MTWARLDDQILENHKVAKAGVLGWALYTAGIAYSARNLTDGLIPYGRIGTLLDFSGVLVENGNAGGNPAPTAGGTQGALTALSARDVAQHLVAIGLWEIEADGYLIH